MIINAHIFKGYIRNIGIIGCRIGSKTCILEQGMITDEGTVKDLFIKQPESLKRLLGDEGKPLPDVGHNIQIAHMVDRPQDGEILARMSKELNYVFPILDGNIQKYQEDSMGIFVINVDDEHWDEVKDYLNLNKLNWKELL